MYRRISYMQMKKKRARRRRMIKLGGALLMAVGIGGISLALAVNALAAPESPGMEGIAYTEGEQEGIGETISGNVAVPETPEVEETTRKEDGKPAVVIDPGHGGADEGCAGEGIQEKNVNLAIARLVQDKLGRMGYQVIMTREDDTYMPKEERVKIANEYGADIYVSIHQNTYEDSSVEGIETWYDGSDSTRDSKRLAWLIHQETLNRTGAVQRQIREDADFHVTGKTIMPACLIETGFLSNPGEREKLSASEYQEQIAEGIVRGIELYFHPKTMYLTFDDGPYVENTARVLDVLKARNIKATFFLVGENVERNPEMAKRIAAEGHTIGIHCYSHDYEAIYQSVDSYVQDFEKAYQVIKETTGVEAKLFRFPGGSVNAYNKKVCKEIAAEMTARGFIYYDWNASMEDAVKDPVPEQLIANAKESTLGREKVVLLAHDVVYATGMCLDDLLEQLPEYRMEVLTEDLEPVHFQMK
ncbi:N-acetylmuramoyl-L-alanine amidase [Lachnospiraceae bacterium]|nr:N-acetylmuramoyl-L-alanine amidase [Lachnospiraceae bacterium]